MGRRISHILLKSIYSIFSQFYDSISWFVSKGKWGKWQSYAIGKIRGKKVLDLGCGTGSLLLQVKHRGYLVFGLDQSKDMLAVCLKKSQKYKTKLNIIRGNMEKAPIKDNAIDTVIVTFPTSDILLPTFFHEVYRILVSDGRFILVDYANFYKKDPINTIFAFLSSFGDKLDIGEIKTRLNNVGFKVRIDQIRDDCSSVKLIMGDKLKKFK